MPVMTFGESNFGIKVPIGRYTCRFLGTEDRKPIEESQFGNAGQPRMAFIFEVIEGEHTGEKISRETNTVPSLLSECGRMILGLAGRELAAKEKVDTDTFINRKYSVKVAVNPKSTKGALYIADLEPLNGSAPPRPAAPPSRPSAANKPAAAAPAADRYFVDHESVAFDETLSADQVNALIQKVGCKAKELAVLREGDTEWKTAAAYLFGDGPIPS